MIRMFRLFVILIPTLACIGQRDIREQGSPIARNDLYTYAGKNIVQKYELLRDSAHFDTAVCAEYSAGSSWAAAGGCSILKDDDSTYYIALRQRSGVGTERGKEWQIWSSTDLTTWDTVWTLVRDSVVNKTFSSIEAVCLRKFGSTYYLYFCFDDGYWRIFYVSASSIAGLKTQLKDRNNWNAILTNNDKDPGVMELNGEYYMVYSHNETPAYHQYLIKSSSPTFSSYDSVGQPGQPYDDKFGYGANDARHPGTIFYDESSGMLIYWGWAGHNKLSDKDIYWFWTGSYDLNNWVYFDRYLAVDGNTYQLVNTRYFDYVAVGENRIVVVMEWDKDEDSKGTTFIWNYTYDPATYTSK